MRIFKCDCCGSVKSPDEDCFKVDIDGNGKIRNEYVELCEKCFMYYGSRLAELQVEFTKAKTAYEKESAGQRKGGEKNE